MAMLKSTKYYSYEEERRDMVVYYFLLLSFCMIFNLNKTLDYVLTTLFVLLFAFSLNRKFFVFTYVALIFFESKLVIPGLGASILRFLPICYLMRFVFNNSCFTKINIKNSLYTIGFIWVFLFAQAQVTTDIFGLFTMSAKLICIAEIALEVYNSNYIDKENYKNLFCFTVALFAMFSGIYGIYNGRILIYEGFPRYCGTIDDPNMSAMLYCLGIVSLFSVKGLPKAVKITMLFVLFFDVALTVSMAGFLSLAILLFIYIFARNYKIGILATVLFTILIVIFCYIPIPEGNIIYGIQTRIITKFHQLLVGDFDGVTTGRYQLAIDYLTYFNQLPIGNILFGGLDTISGEFRDFMFNLIGNVSHNSYIDMLYMHGYVGMVIMISIITLRSIQLLIKNHKNKGKKDIYYLSFALQKITLLLFSTNLSLYPFRYYVFFMLI